MKKHDIIGTLGIAFIAIGFLTVVYTALVGASCSGAGSEACWTSFHPLITAGVVGLFLLIAGYFGITLAEELERRAGND